MLSHQNTISLVLLSVEFAFLEFGRIRLSKKMLPTVTHNDHAHADVQPAPGHPLHTPNSPPVGRKRRRKKANSAANSRRIQGEFRRIQRRIQANSNANSRRIRVGFGQNSGANSSRIQAELRCEFESDSGRTQERTQVEFGQNSGANCESSVFFIF